MRIYNKSVKIMIDSGTIKNYINKQFLRVLGITNYKKE